MKLVKVDEIPVGRGEKKKRIGQNDRRVHEFGA